MEKTEFNNKKKPHRFPGVFIWAWALSVILLRCCRLGESGAGLEGDSMIVDTLDRAERHFDLHPAFQKAFAFLRQASLPDLPPGRVDIDGDRVYCIVSSGLGRKRDETRLETHRKYIDIQYVIEGVDEMGWKPAASCGIPDGSYDENRDVAFFKDRPRKWIKVPAGSFAVFFPRDAHAPMAGKGNIRKAVVKVALEKGE